MGSDANKKTIVIVTNMSSKPRRMVPTLDGAVQRSVNVSRFQRFKSLGSNFNVHVLGDMRPELRHIMNDVVGRQKSVYSSMVQSKGEYCAGRAATVVAQDAFKAR